MNLIFPPAARGNSRTACALYLRKGQHSIQNWLSMGLATPPYQNLLFSENIAARPSKEEAVATSATEKTTGQAYAQTGLSCYGLQPA